MISRIYISHCELDEDLALDLSQALWRVGVESYAAMHRLCPGLSRADRVSFGIRNSECLVALLTNEGSISATVNQEIGLARGIDLLIIPFIEVGVKPPFFIEHLSPISFSRSEFANAIGQLIKMMRDLTRLDWLKVTCPRCGEEMTQYLTPKEESELAMQKGTGLETICSYCQNAILLDPRTFAPLP
jgi:hypothetical protein